MSFHYQQSDCDSHAIILVFLIVFATYHLWLSTSKALHPVTPWSRNGDINLHGLTKELVDVFWFLMTCLTYKKPRIWTFTTQNNTTFTTNIHNIHLSQEHSQPTNQRLGVKFRGVLHGLLQLLVERPSLGGVFGIRQQPHQDHPWQKHRRKKKFGPSLCAVKTSLWT